MYYFIFIWPLARRSIQPCYEFSAKSAKGRPFGALASPIFLNKQIFVQNMKYTNYFISFAMTNNK